MIIYAFSKKCKLYYFIEGALYKGTVLHGSPYIIDFAKGLSPLTNSTYALVLTGKLLQPLITTRLS
jgi:hypothetical protein